MGAVGGMAGSVAPAGCELLSAGVADGPPIAAGGGSEALGGNESSLHSSSFIERVYQEGIPVSYEPDVVLHDPCEIVPRVRKRKEHRRQVRVNLQVPFSSVCLVKVRAFDVRVSVRIRVRTQGRGQKHQIVDDIFTAEQDEDSPRSGLYYQPLYVRYELAC